jgi:hypothetical protein
MFHIGALLNQVSSTKIRIWARHQNFHSSMDIRTVVAVVTTPHERLCHPYKFGLAAPTSEYKHNTDLTDITAQHQ